jgi:hypothetical protein
MTDMRGFRRVEQRQILGLEHPKSGLRMLSLGIRIGWMIFGRCLSHGALLLVSCAALN